jgi:hypothetical protein
MAVALIICVPANMWPLVHYQHRQAGIGQAFCAHRASEACPNDQNIEFHFCLSTDDE